MPVCVCVCVCVCECMCVCVWVLVCVCVSVCVWFIRLHWIKPIISNSAQIQQICLPASNHIILDIMPTSSIYCTHTHTHTHTQRERERERESNPWLRVGIIRWSVTRRTMTVKCSLLEAHKTYTVGPLHRPRLFFPFIDQHKQYPRVYYIQYICIYCTYLYIYIRIHKHTASFLTLSSLGKFNWIWDCGPVLLFCLCEIQSTV